MALTEVLAGVMQVDDVAVESHFFDDLGADSMVMAQFCARVRKRSDLPSVSMKDIYRHPTIKDLAASFTKSAAPNPCEGALAEVLAGVMQVDDVAVESHFFDDLGADSMVMAQFCARVRKRSDLPSVSMKDVYRHPTIKDLAAAFAGSSLAPPAESPPADSCLSLRRPGRMLWPRRRFRRRPAPDGMSAAGFCSYSPFLATVRSTWPW